MASSLLRTDSSASLLALTSVSSPSTSTTKTPRRRPTRQYSSAAPSPSSSSFHTRPAPKRRDSAPPAISPNDAAWLAGMVELLDDAEREAKDCTLQAKAQGYGGETLVSVLLYMGQWVVDRWYQTFPETTKTGSSS